MSAQILVINRVSSLGKQTVNLLRCMGYSGVMQANSPNEAKNKISKFADETLIVLELTPYSTSSDLDFLFEVCLSTNVIVTSPVVEKDFIVKAKKLGVKDFIIKVTDKNYVADKFKQAIEKYVITALP